MESQLRRIYDVLNDLYKEGFVPTGMIELTKPPNIMVEPDVTILASGPIGKILIATRRKVVPLQSLGMTGNTCDKCGGLMKRSGTCEVCTSCGETSGCS